MSYVETWELSCQSNIHCQELLMVMDALIMVDEFSVQSGSVT